MITIGLTLNEAEAVYRSLKDQFVVHEDQKEVYAFVRNLDDKIQEEAARIRSESEG